jgi:hypothetical protein
MALNKLSYQFIEENAQNYIAPIRAGQSISDLGWRTYSDVAAISPVDGIGGTPLVTWALNTTSPLSGEADLRFVKGASNRQGEGVSIDFSITNRHLAKILQITFDMELISGTYADGDLRVYIVADPYGTPVVIEPVGTTLQLGVVGQRVREIASFQTSPIATSYRLVVHVASTSAFAYTVDFANFKVWEPTQAIGAVITDWTQHILTSSNTQGIGTPYASPSQNVRWRRIGSNLEMRGNFRLGTTTASEFRVNFPNGLVANITPATDRNDSEVIGYLAIESASLTANRTLHTKNGFGYFNVGTQRSDVTSNPLSANNGDSISSDQDVTFYLSVPIAGWGSSVAMSSDTGDGRVVAARYTGWVAQAITSTTTRMRFSTLSYDTHGAYNSSTGIFTAPISGYYRWSFVGRFDYSARIDTYVGNSFYDSGVDTALASFNTMFSGQVFLQAGQTLDWRAANNGNATATGGTTSLSIERISAGSQQIAATETVAARYTTDTAQNNNIIKCEDKDFDTHNAYNTSTGKYTIPVSGVYRISGQTTYDNLYHYADIRKNNDVTICRDLISISTGTGYTTCKPSVTTRLLAGETVYLWAYSNGSLVVDSIAAARNMFCIERIGN